MKHYIVVSILTFSFLLPSAVLPALAAGQTQTAPTASVDVACVQSAIEARDSAIISAIDAYASAVKSALSARKDALKAGWALTDKKARRSALRAAWNVYRKAIRDARKDLRISRQSAWSHFRQDSRLCKHNAADEPGGGQGADAQL